MKCNIIITGFIITVSALLASCQEKENFNSPAGYNLNEPEKFFLPETLQEISGITFGSSTSDSIYAIQDEQGRLFHLKLGEKKFTTTKFGKQGDYEDVAIANNTVLVLKSNGTLYAFPEIQADEPDSVTTWKDMLPKGEYESLYADAGKKQLYVLCKNCEADKKTNTVNGYILQWTSDSLKMVTGFVVNTGDIRALTKKEIKNFRPSCLAKNPVTKEWYIIASIDKLLVVTDANWKVKQVYDLNPANFGQPEGIVFDADNNLYISNEGDDLNAATILKFAYSPK